MDGALIAAAASIKSFRPKEEARQPWKHHRHGGSMTPGRRSLDVDAERFKLLADGLDGGF